MHHMSETVPGTSRAQTLSESFADARIQTEHPLWTKVRYLCVMLHGSYPHRVGPFGVGTFNIRLEMRIHGISSHDMEYMSHVRSELCAIQGAEMSEVSV